MNEQDNGEKQRVVTTHKKEHSVLCGILISKKQGHICFEEDNVSDMALDAFKGNSTNKLCKECFSETIVEDFKY